MANKVIMPKQGLLMTEGTITSWMIDEGEQIEEGQPLFEMETDKLTIEIDSPASGTLLKIIKGVGEVVPITETIAVIGEPGEDISEFLEEENTDTEEETDTVEEENIPQKEERTKKVEDAEARKAGDRIFITPRAKKLAKDEEIEISSILGTGPKGLIIEEDVLEAIKNPAKRIKSTPVAEKMAEEYGINMAHVSGSGVHGRISKDDIEEAVRLRNRPGALENREEKLIPLTGIRKIISNKMMESVQNTAQANHRMKVDMSEVIRLREKLKAEEIKVSFNDVLVKITSKALMEYPLVNSSLTEEGIIAKEYVNMGIAVSISNGLIVPVIRNSDLLTIKEINNVSSELIEKARTGTLELDDYSGGTFTITNLGMFDIDEFTAIINTPESGILAIGKINKEAVVEGEDIVVKPMMVLSLTYDHRIIDGALAAQFLQRIKTIINNPYLLL